VRDCDIVGFALNQHKGLELGISPEYIKALAAVIDDAFDTAASERISACNKPMDAMLPNPLLGC
jgi:hypothetical protein